MTGGISTGARNPLPRRGRWRDHRRRRSISSESGPVRLRRLFVSRWPQTPIASKTERTLTPAITSLRRFSRSPPSTHAVARHVSPSWVTIVNHKMSCSAQRFAMQSSSCGLLSDPEKGDGNPGKYDSCPDWAENPREVTTTSCPRSIMCFSTPGASPAWRRTWSWQNLDATQGSAKELGRQEI